MAPSSALLLSQFGGEAEAREKAVAPVGFLGERFERGLGFVALLVAGQAKRFLEAGAGLLGAGLLRVLPVAPAAHGRQHDQKAADDQAIIALPDLRHAVATVFVVDLADELVVGSHASPAAAPPP